MSFEEQAPLESSTFYLLSGHIVSSRYSNVFLTSPTENILWGQSIKKIKETNTICLLWMLTSITEGMEVREDQFTNSFEKKREMLNISNGEPFFADSN